MGVDEASTKAKNVVTVADLTHEFKPLPRSNIAKMTESMPHTKRLWKIMEIGRCINIKHQTATKDFIDCNLLFDVS